MNSSWLELRVVVPEEQEDAAAWELAAIAPQGVRVEPAGAGDVRLVAHLELGATAAAWEARVASTLAGFPGARWEWGALPDDDWLARWRREVQPVRLSRRVWVRPPWHRAPLAAGEIDLVIEPGMAFGTGHHETTRLVAGFLDERLRVGGRYLDLGCGTAILGMAALRLGAHRVYLNDIDPVACEVAREEIDRNQLADRVEWVDFPPDGLAAVDGVLLNIVAGVVLDLLPRVKECLGVGSWVATSGILVTQAPEVIECGRSLGLELLDERSEGEWWGGLLARVA